MAGSDSLLSSSALIYKEEVIDLLKGDENGKGVGPSRVPIQIRETTNGGILLVGITEVEVTSQEEMMSLLLRGFVRRSTGITNMNSQTSLSPAIFTIYMEQKRIIGMESGRLSAKLHLIDVVGSKRVKKTGLLGCAYEKVAQSQVNPDSTIAQRADTGAEEYHVLELQPEGPLSESIFEACSLRDSDDALVMLR
ncbi:kinesin-like protein KIN-4C [Tanacetum coccineum]